MRGAATRARGSIAFSLGVALLRNLSFVGVSSPWRRPVVSSPLAAVDCDRVGCVSPDSTAASEQEPGLAWAAGRDSEDTTTLGNMQPTLDEFAKKLMAGAAGTQTVKERKEQEADAALEAISSGVLHKVRKAANSMLGDGVWDAAVDAIASYCGGDQMHAHYVLAKAFKWKVWVEMNEPEYWKPKPFPPAQHLRNVLRWLREGPLAMTEDELKSALLSEPLPFLTNPAKKYVAARSCAPEQWRGKEVFRELLRREPKVLRLTWNCCYTDPSERARVLGMLPTGESLHCDGRCMECWRSVTPSLMGMRLDGVGV